MAASKAKKQTEPDAAEEQKTVSAAASEEDSGGAEKVKPTGVTGPGTGSASPEDEQERSPSTTVLPTEAGPLVPTDVQKVHEPADGHPESSTNTVAAGAALRTVPGENHVRLHTEDGEDVDVEDLFTEPLGASRMVEVKQRVFQTFTYHKARTPTTRLAYNKGARIPLAEAERFKASLKTLQSS